MLKRTCVIIYDDVDKLLRIERARLIRKNQAHCSYSCAINYALRKYFKNHG